MVTTATPTQEPKTVAHYRSSLRPIWCAGCGDFGVLAAFYEALVALDIDKSSRWSALRTFPGDGQ